MRVLMSVSNKDGIVGFAQQLAGLGCDLISTGQTQRILREAGLPVHAVSDVTGFPEILDGRVKTLHPTIHGGILARRNLPNHQQQLEEHRITPIDIVVVNLYPFAETVAHSTTTLADALEQIDIGGVALLRAAAKNFHDVIVVVDPADYEPLLAELRSGAVSLDFRHALALRAFAHTAHYDATIATYLSQTLPTTPDTPSARPHAPLVLSGRHTANLRYGENPHQHGALYGDFFDVFEYLHGKELSYTNILDTVAAQELIEEFPPHAQAAVAILKHTNPCGVGLGPTTVDAWKAALATDSRSAFGGIVVTNHPCDAALAQALDEIFTEIVIAPAFDATALSILRAKKNRRLLRICQPMTMTSRQVIRSVPGGLLVQDADVAPMDEESLRVVTQRAPTDEEYQALKFAWRVAKHVKSNAIVYANTTMTLGIGAGQMSRVDSAYLAAWKAANAGLSLSGSVMASDAFFPFADGVETAAQAGATAVIQPGGSMRDDEVIAAANEHNLAMLFTGRRHFRH